MAHYLNLEGLSTFLTNIKNNVKGWLGINASSGSSTKFLNEQGNFASLKALAFKDTASYSDLSSGVQSSLDKADTALQSHQSVTDNNPTLAWGTTSTVGTVGNTNLRVTMPSNPASGKLDTTGNASNTTSTFTKASGDTSTMTSGSKLSAIFTAISSFFASVASHLSNTSNPHNVTAAQVGAEPAFSVLPISKGGTGKTTSKAATNNLFSDITSEASDLTDTTILVYKYTTPYDQKGVFYTRPVTKLWNYIKGKISSILGLSENGYTGNAATATSATSATTAAGYTNDGAIATALAGKLDTTGDASNTTSTFTKNASDTSSMTSGSKLSAIFTSISNVFASFKALAFKDKASYNDLSSGVQSSLDKADTALQAAVEYVTTSSTWQTLETAYNAGKTLILKVENGTNWFDEYRLTAVYQSSGSDRFIFCGFPTMVNLVGGIVESLEVTEWICYFEENATRWTTTTVDGLELPTKGYVDGKLPASGTTPITKTYAINIDGNAGTATTVNNLAAVAIEATSSSPVDLNSYNTTSSALGDTGLKVFNWGASSAPYVSNSPFNASGILYVGGYGSGFTNQWAINRTTGDIYFRYCEYNATNWSGWKKINNMGQVGTPTNPVYIDINGAAQPCGFSVNFGTPVSGANVLNIITA